MTRVQIIINILNVLHNSKYHLDLAEINSNIANISCWSHLQVDQS